jgi:hypothetical protein
MRGKQRILIGALAMACLLSGFAQSAYARHSSKPHYKIKKNDGPFGGNYMKPKKQKKPKGYYTNSLTGATVYGTTPKK